MPIFPFLKRRKKIVLYGLSNEFANYTGDFINAIDLIVCNDAELANLECRGGVF